MASRKLSSLLYASSSSTAAATSLCSLGEFWSWGRGKNRFSTSVSAAQPINPSAVTEEPINPAVKINHTQLLIDGQFVDAASGKTFPTFDPRTGDIIAHVSEGESEDVNRAVAAARKAFDEGPWPRMTAYERSLIMFRFADLLEKHREEIAGLETWDNGKPYEQFANIELPMVIRQFRYYAGWADKIHGLTVPADGHLHVQTLHEPFGVAALIVPWNFPLLLYSWKVGAALACGNTVVVKTSEQTPLSALYVSKLFHEAGLPPGVLNVICGFGPSAGASLCSHMDVDKVSFTGSTDTAKTVLELAAKSNLKSATLELGGKSPFIVCEDADIDKAAELAHSALFFNQGQCCVAGSRTFVHESAYDEFVEKAKTLALNRVVGDPFKKGVEQGPQIDNRQMLKILKYIRSGIEDGATLEAGGERFGSKGCYVQPTVFSNVLDDMLIAKDEIFGPVQSISKFSDLEEVVRRANATRYGLAAGVFTQNIDTANTLTRALRAGTIWINCYDIFDAAIPFGGYKMSGQGREKGLNGLTNYLQVKAVVTPLKNPAWL
ncbi:hypothetical protein SLE2022_280010 [Rubroshorea leprosula]